jgi:hypothetical protein
MFCFLPGGGSREELELRTSNELERLGLAVAVRHDCDSALER